MRLAVWAVPFACCLSAPAAWGQYGDRFVERAPLPKVPPPNTMSRAGNSASVAPWAVPGVSRFEAGGYVGGATVHGNNALARGPAATAGAPGVGTFGLDFIGFRLRPGRVFLAPSADPSAAGVYARNYRAEGPHVPDVFSLRPFRKAVLEKREVVEERKGGAEH